MANRLTPPIARGASRRAPPSMTERQLHAYFLARDTVRRLRDAAMRTAAAPAGPPDRPCQPPASAPRRDPRGAAIAPHA